MSSAEFYAHFVVGDAGDDPEVIGWAARYESFVRLKSAIAEGLKLVVAIPVLAPA